MRQKLESRIDAALDQRVAAGLERVLKVRASHEALLDLANNDYLRLSQHPQVKAAAMAAIERWGCSSSASPLITGFTEAHAELLDTLKSWYGFRAGMLWNTGYAANQAVLGKLPQRGDLVLADRLIHNSMISGLLSSGARLQRYRHLDLKHLASLLAETEKEERTVFVVTESVYSMDGDYPDLQAMAELKRRHGFVWIVDEAHAIGWYGQTGSGLVEATGVAAEVDVLVGTLGKGLGSMGAFTLFRDERLERYLTHFAGEFIYSTYLPPACAAAAQAAVEIIANAAGQAERLQAMSRKIRRAIYKAPVGDAPIIPVRTDDPVAVASTLCAAGYRVGAIRPPTVPQGEARLRISLNANLSEHELTRLAETINAETTCG